MKETPVTIRRLASAAGVHVETVRYYQRRGLLNVPRRPPGGIRRYGKGDVARLQFIRRAQAMGFSLDEIAGLLTAKGQRTCERARQLTEHKLADVRRRLVELHALEKDLIGLVAACKRAGEGECCPTLERFEHADLGSDTADATQLHLR
jgi:MerR family mercuric resistance operon transcriptional regulator